MTSSWNLTPEGFIHIPITEEMTQKAQAKASEMGELRNSIRRGKGNLCGFLGEEAVLAAFPGAESANTFQHDIQFEDVTFEVKSKDRTRPPEINYEASIANFNATQKADFYVFVSLLRDKATNTYTDAYVIGIMAKDEYKKKATFLRVGDIDPSNGWVVSADCYNVPHSELHRFS